ncbi:MAG: peptide chain release factor 1 [PVC group bacterium]
MSPTADNTSPDDREFLLRFSARLNSSREELGEIGRQMADPEIGQNPPRIRRLGREYSRLGKVVSLHDRYLAVLREIEESRRILQGEEEDPELREMARAELAKLEEEKASVWNRLEVLILPPDERDERDSIVEIRSGTGGAEAALFALDLFRMYGRYAERRGLRIENLDTHPAAQGGLKEVTFGVVGEGAYRAFKLESGVHRVQRVPATESQGRIHTSAASVAVFPEAEEVEVKIEPNDLRIDRFCSSGPGGQSVNTTYSAVRITHLPTGIVVSCQDEKSQHKNKASALKVLRARLYQKMQAEQDAELARQRKAQIKSGDRSDKIRTYNYPQNRVTDHRINLSLHRLESVMNGDLDELVGKLMEWERRQRLDGQNTE